MKVLEKNIIYIHRRLLIVDLKYFIITLLTYNIKIIAITS